MRPAARILSVKELTRYIRMKLDGDSLLQEVWIRGEISNFTRHSSGHLYFTLKDESSRIKAVMFQSHALRLKFLPREGARVLARGQVAVFERDGQYQLYVQEMQPDGIGSLYLAFDQLKRKLADEGLFDPERKRPLPRMPGVIGVLTSADGAAVRDILITLRRRFPLVRVLLLPVPVQGTQAAPAIARAIQVMNGLGEAEVLIVGRGGGSLEELWPFNEEAVARAIAESAIPVISAVGHETDVTIADFAADLRAATPTAAAELAVPMLQDLQARVAELRARLLRGAAAAVAAKREAWTRLRAAPSLNRPERLVAQPAQQLDRLRERLRTALTERARHAQDRLRGSERRLARVHPGERWKLAAAAMREQDHRLKREMRALLEDKRRDWRHAIARLDGLSPLKVMMRGYAMVYAEDGERLMASTAGIGVSDRIRVRMRDGALTCEVLDIARGGTKHGGEEAVQDGTGAHGTGTA